MSFCDTTCTYTFFSVRHDKKTICEGREWTFANGCLFSQPCDKSVRQLPFLSVTVNYMIPNESAYSLLFVSGSWLFVYWRKRAETLQTHFSVFCADSGSCCLQILIMFTYLFSKLPAKLRSFFQNRADLCEFLSFHADILLFLLLVFVIYVTIEQLIEIILPCKRPEVERSFVVWDEGRMMA